MKYNIEKASKITRSALIGQAVGDALGVPVEFLSRAQVRNIGLTEMVGCDVPHTFISSWGDYIPAGAWSDDTSMAIATMASITDRKYLAYNDIMNRFIEWWYTGKYCSLNFPFGLGGTVNMALANYLSNIPAIHCGPNGFKDNGNGALMRILPFALYCIFKDYTLPATIKTIYTASSLTHGHVISKFGCLVFTVFLKELLTAASIEDAWENTRQRSYTNCITPDSFDAYRRLFAPDFVANAESIIGETGYVVDTLMTAVYSMLTGHDYESTVLTAINMGYDTDTNAAVTGALAGAYYGIDSIPDRWKDKLLKRHKLETYADNFVKAIVRP